MKNLKFLFLFVALLTLGLTSCTKEDVVIDDTENPAVDPESGISNPLFDNLETRSGGSDDGIVLACFSIDFPFSLDVDGDIVEVNSEDDLEAALEGLADGAFVDFVYPLDITYEDGTEESVADGEALGLAFATCVPDDGWVIDTTSFDEDLFPAFLITSDESCFDLVYPVSLVNIEGEISTADSEEALVELLASTDYADILFFDFPLTIVGEDGEQVINSGEELFEAFASCWDDGTGYDTSWTYGGDIGCYGVEFPFSVTLANGNTLTVNNHDELCALMIEGTIAGFVYPLNLITVEGEIITVNNDDELNTALEDCWDGGVIDEQDITLLILISASNNGDGEGCFDVVYPLTLNNLDSTTQVVNNYSELIDISFEMGLTVEYPFSLIPNSTGVSTEVNSFEELAAVLEDCE